MTHILNGRQLADKIKSDLRQETKHLIAQHECTPGLAVIKVGNNIASDIYVRNKRHACQELGYHSTVFDLPYDTTTGALLALIQTLNEDPLIHGILLQLPLPSHIEQHSALESIDPLKDIDGFHPYNFGRLAQGRPTLKPCTPAGIMALLATTKVSLSGLHAVVVGTSQIVGRPMSLELLQVGCTVTLCHSKTVALPTHISRADILVVAIGSPEFIQGSWLKPGAIVIDVGITRSGSKLLGDVDFAAAQDRAGWITPVPGGVGPMTIAYLLHNTLSAYKNQLGLSR